VLVPLPSYIYFIGRGWANQDDVRSPTTKRSFASLRDRDGDRKSDNWLIISTLRLWRGHVVIRKGHLSAFYGVISHLSIYRLLEICRAVQSVIRNADSDFCILGQTGFSPMGSPSTRCRRAVRNLQDVDPASGTRRLRERLRVKSSSEGTVQSEFQFVA
jgi:hypothetical protein